MTEFKNYSSAQGKASHCVAMDALTLYFSGDEQAALQLSQGEDYRKVDLAILEKAARHVAEPELAQPLRMFVLK